MKGFKHGAQTGAGVESHGRAMGFKKGGQVKASKDFLMKTEKTGNPADHGNMPKTEGDSEQEKEAGGRSKVRPGYKKGGYVACRRGGMQCYKKGGKYYMQKGGKMVPYVEKSVGGAVAKGAKKMSRAATAAHKRHGAKAGEGESVKPAGRGAKNIGKGGKTGAHKHLHKARKG